MLAAFAASSLLGVGGTLCTPIAKTNCPGYNVVGAAIVKVHSVADCCAHCAATKGCTSWTWNSGGNLQCFPKSGCPSPSSTGANAHCTSGSAVPIPTPPAPAPTPDWNRPWLDTSLPRAERVKALVGAMTLEEKINQMVVDTPTIDRLGVPAYHWRNNILHGTVDNGVSTQFPQSIGMAASWGATLLHGVGRILADEQRAKHNIDAAARGGSNTSRMDYGLDLWGPNINMFWNPVWGRGQETYGEDPFLTAALMVGFVNGLQGENTTNAKGERIYETGATCKHFIAYGIDKMPPRLSFDPNITQWQLQQYFYPAWQACAATAQAVMCAYNGVNGDPMCMSPMLSDVLENDFNFKTPSKPENYIVTDSGALSFMVSKFHKFNQSSDAAAAALVAGVDLNSGNVFKGLLNLFEHNDTRVSIGMVDAAMTRLFSARMSFGLFDPQSDYPEWSALGAKDVLSPAHIANARGVAQRSILMLKNDNATLPLPSTVRRIAVIGWGANDTYAALGNYMGCGHSAWGPRLTNCSIVTPLVGLRAHYAKEGVEIVYARGCDVESSDTSGFAAAVSAAKGADAVIYVGGNRNCEGGQGKGGAHCESEGHDRPDVAMPGVQTELIQALAKVNEKVIVALLTGSVIGVEWEAKNVGAIVVIWYGGTTMGDALADVVSGAVSPSARSPLTWYANATQLPTSELDISLLAAPGRTYRHFTQTPLYAFGFGLGYAKFGYTNAVLTPNAISANGAAGGATICVDVKHLAASAWSKRGAGSKAEEVVEVYAIPPQSAVAAADAAPKVMLIGFTRTAPLAAGAAAARVCIALSADSLRMVVKGKDAAVLPGKYEVTIGGRGPNALGTYVHEDAVAAPLTVEWIVQA